MKKLLVGALVVVGLIGSSCVIEATTCRSDEVMINGICYARVSSCPAGQVLRDGYCWAVGASCDFVNDQDCMSRTQAWWCDTSGIFRINDCLTQCAGLAPYACCGYDPTRGDDACLCCMDASCGGFTCHI